MNLWLGFYICVQGPTSSTTSSAPVTSSTSAISSSVAVTIPATTTSTITTSTIAPPSPTEPSTISTCTDYHLVVSGDTCYSIEQTYDITPDQVRTITAPSYYVLLSCDRTNGMNNSSMSGIPTSSLIAAVFGCHFMFVLEHRRLIPWIDYLESGTLDEGVRIPSWSCG